MFEQHFAKAPHEGTQPFFGHIGDEFVMHTALPKQRVSALLDGIGLQVAVIPQGFTCSAEKREQHHGKRIEQPKAIAPCGRADAHPTHPHAKAQVFGVKQAKLVILVNQN